MATSYANPGGSGDRTAIITVTTNITALTNGPISKYVDGALSGNMYFGAYDAVAGLYIQFDFGVGKVIDEAKHYQSTAHDHGTWKWQGSNNGTDWTDIGSSFTFGGATTQTQTSMNGNTVVYRYYRILGVSGNLNAGPDLYEFEFKIEQVVAYDGQVPLTFTPQAETYGPHDYVGEIPLTLTPQAETYGSHAYDGQIPLTFAPQSVSAVDHMYDGLILHRLIPIADYEPVPAGSSTTIPASTGGWAMGGAGVWASSTPTHTDLDEVADAEPTGFYLGGDPEIVSTIPQTDEIVPEGGFAFCGAGATGDAATTFPASEVIEAEVAFKFGGAGVITQVAAADIPSDVLVPTGGFVLSGSGFSLDPGVTPTATVIVPTGGWKLGGIRPDPVEVTYPESFDRVIVSRVAFEMGGEGVWEDSTPESTVIDSLGAFLKLGGAGLCTSKMPPSTAIVTGEGGYVLAGATPEEVFEAWCLSGQAFEPSVFSGFNFNSFAVKGGQAYACGDAGIYLLGADHDAGEPIQSGARIGPVNFGADREKRIRGIQYGRGGKDTRVRVLSDEGNVGVFTPERDNNRVVVSRDIQGREFTIDIMDFEELSHCEIVPLRLARR